MDECFYCDFWDSDREGCTCDPYQKWFACPIESQEPENQQALREYVEQLPESRDS